MKYIFELSKEHKTLPEAEVLTCLTAENISYNVIELNDDVLVIETSSKYDEIKRLAGRLSLTFYIDEFLFSCLPSTGEIKKHSLENIIEKKGSIAIRCKNRSNTIDSQLVVKALAEIYSKDRRVTLEKPDIEIRGYITDTCVYVGLKIAEVDRHQFEQRRVQYRPFFSPISLHPKLARALVNLSAIQRNEILLDPFCGTGGLLIEAGLVGVRVIGGDIEARMIDGCRKTLDFYKIKNYELYRSDIGDIRRYVGMVNAVVTDMPYGKSTTTKGEGIEQLYERAFENILMVLKEHGRAVVGLSNKDMISLGEQYFSLVEKHKLRVHRSLTRYFAVYQK